MWPFLTGFLAYHCINLIYIPNYSLELNPCEAPPSTINTLAEKNLHNWNHLI